MSVPPSPLKSRCPTIDQSVVTVPAPVADAIAAPFMNHSASWPLVSRQTMSLRQSPLKSWARVDRAVNTHAAPAELLSDGPPTTAVLQDSATDQPWWAAPTAPLPTNLFPCWVHPPPLLINTHAAPAPLLSSSPPTMAVTVLPSADSATDWPCRAAPTAPVPTSLRSCVHPKPLSINTHAAPTKLLSAGPPTIAALPAPDSATDWPWSALLPITGAPTSFSPCCVHTPPLRVNTHAAPVKVLSNGPPTRAVLPSADNATE